MRIKGIVLAGGKSSRFGPDKSLARHEGRTFVEIALGSLGEAGLQTAVVSSAGKGYNFLEETVLQDGLEAKGPLGGIHTAMSFYDETDLLVMTCDMPLLGPRTLRTLLEAYRTRRALTHFEGPSGAFEPFPGIFPHELHRSIARRIRSNELSVRSFMRSVLGRNALRFEGDASEWTNVNFTSDLGRLAGV
jgi:molybdenum cofactor guanylyltransferase